VTDFVHTLVAVIIFVEAILNARKKKKKEKE